MSNHVHLKTLSQALAIVGGKDELARRLQIDPARLERWLSGEEKPALGAFLLAADLVVDAVHARLSEIFEQRPLAAGRKRGNGTPPAAP